MDDLADPSMLGDLDESDPKSMARWMRKMGAEAGEDDDWLGLVDDFRFGPGELIEHLLGLANVRAVGDTHRKDHT